MKLKLVESFLLCLYVLAWLPIFFLHINIPHSIDKLLHFIAFLTASLLLFTVFHPHPLKHHIILTIIVSVAILSEYIQSLFHHQFDPLDILANLTGGIFAFMIRTNK